MADGACDRIIIVVRHWLGEETINVQNELSILLKDLKDLAPEISAKAS